MAVNIPMYGESMDISHGGQDYDFMDMINEDAYEHDDDAFFEAPEHPDGMVGIEADGNASEEAASEEPIQVLDQDSAMDVDPVPNGAAVNSEDEVDAANHSYQLQHELDSSVKDDQTFDHANPTVKQDVTDTNQIPKEGVQQQLDSSIDHDHPNPPADGIAKPNPAVSTLDSHTLTSGTVVGDDQTVTASHRAVKRARYNPEDEPKEHIDVVKTTGNNQYTAAYRAAIFKKEPSQSSQPSKPSIKNESRGSPTPPIKTSQSSNQDLATAFSDLVLPNPEKDIPRFLQAHTRFHMRTVDLKPKLELLPHRYWVAVLNPPMQLRNASQEQHYMWFKANRMTTIETVWRIYGDATAQLDFVFVMAGMKLEFEQQLEELDLFNDKVIVLRVVEEDKVGGVVKRISEGLVKPVTEVIELD